MLFVSLLLVLLRLRVFFSKLLIIFCNVFWSYLFSQNISVRYSIPALKYILEQTLVGLARNNLNMLVILSDRIQKCCLICAFIRAGLRWASNSYLPLLFFISISRKFKHFSSFSSSIINWTCLTCLFKIWNSRDCSLDMNHACVSSTYGLYIFGARFRCNYSAMALLSKVWMWLSDETITKDNPKCP